MRWLIRWIAFIRQLNNWNMYKNAYVATAKSLSTLTTFLYVFNVICFTFLSLDKQRITNTRLTTFFMTLIDIDECASGVHDCHSSASCTNTVGSFSCSCSHPYTGDGKTCTHSASGKYVTFTRYNAWYLYNRVKCSTFFSCYWVNDICRIWFPLPKYPNWRNLSYSILELFK